MKQKENKAIIIEKKIECIIGIIFLIIPFISVFCFLLNWFGCDWSFVRMQNLSGEWEYQGEASSPAPLFIGLMAVAGVHMLKDSFRYFFINGNNQEDNSDQQ